MIDAVSLLRKNGLLKQIDERVDIDLEIAHTSYIEVKKSDSKALLFTNVTDKSGRKYPPVLTNLYGSKEATRLIFGCEPDVIAERIEALLKPKKPKNFKQKLDFLAHLYSMKNTLVKRESGRGECQERVLLGDEARLSLLPALRTWQGDAGRFITMGQVYTQSLDGEQANLGMYRLQIYDDFRLGMHWQIHKDGAHFFHEYKRAGRKMPVSVAIGGDPLYIWCGQAPLPKGVFELLLYGFIRGRGARLVKSITNEIYIPHDADFVIEGFVDTDKFEIEGPFGDHTGFYTPAEPFPFMQVSAITSKREPIFYATVVGKPPLEDKFMGYATERVFLPLLRTTVPELIDYNMPENGVFHNLILAKINTLYPAHAKQAMHAFWGVGQMSFVKHAIFVPSDAPRLEDYDGFSDYVLDRFAPHAMLISEGVCDQLDHASPNSCFGGKLGIDATIDFAPVAPNLLSDGELLDKFNTILPAFSELYTYKRQSKNPICVVKFDKSVSAALVLERLGALREHFRIIVLLDSDARLKNPYMIIWRVVNNIDAKRDIYINGELVCVDATKKGENDGYTRAWPNMTDCTKSVVKSLADRGIVGYDEVLFEKFEIFG
ncbi:menaquinone biosynthesis decarboxylase [Campylobacter sp. 19-13652]|uniref:menaquinone biosynthesis decarboxylase n=1 Tax=Campylobacter sp. 19-13652 TaxID=2840180 RepID=UPI001C78C63C|nr:menaquinone biosynthesis decarboxylase [Campylobacter sp. 19-13652]BCX79208.1 menaquinone biosynthesis decarboxylase [Campylobacter sp. 19-13652]